MGPRSPTAARCALLGIITCGPLWACGLDGLEGSIDGSLSLDYSRVSIFMQGADLIVEYLRESREGVEKVCKLVVNTRQLTVGGQTDIDIEGEDFTSRVGLTRATYDNSSFPEIERGELHFDVLVPEEDGDVKGDFKIAFVTQQSLQGWFAGQISQP